MKQKILLLSIILSLVEQNIFTENNEEKKCNAQCSVSKNFFMPRAFVSYQEHDLYQMAHAQAFKDKRKLNFSFVGEYMQNFGANCNNCKNLGSLPFWSGTNTLTVGTNDGRADLDAYQFGLGNIEVDENGIAGTITLDPRIQHIGMDMSMYWVENVEADGFYFRVHTPFVAMSVESRISMEPFIGKSNDLSFTQTSTGGTTFDYQNLQYPTPVRRPYDILNAFWGGEARANILAGALTKTIRLDYGRIAPGKQTALRLGDITGALGYNFFANEKGFFGLGFKFSCPTGNIPTAYYMLEPIVGRSGLWGAGAEVCGQYEVWKNEEKKYSLNLSYEGEILHLFSGRSPNMRSFDLRRNGLGSKYLLVQHYTDIYASTSADRDVSKDGDVNPNYEVFSSAGLHQAINFTTLPVISKIDVEGSFAMMLNFKVRNINAALGAEVWGRSREKICIDRDTAVEMQLPDLNHFGVIGHQLSFYHVPGAKVPSSISNNSDNIYTYLCEPYAMIGKSQNPAQLTGIYPGSLTEGLSAPTELPEGVKDARKYENRIPEDYNEALDIEGAAVSSALTGKIFGQVGYTFAEHRYIPTLALVGGIEFTGKTNSALQLWSLGFQASLNF